MSQQQSPASSGLFLTGLYTSLLILAFVFPHSVSAENPASKSAPTLWTFAWVSDMHMNGSNLDYLTGAMHFIDRELKPNFVLITGDNNYQPAPPANPDEAISLRRQRFLKSFLKKNLKAPYVIIPGDNWPADFEKVFGPRQFSFNFGGMHFLLLAPDRAYTATHQEGLTVFDPATKQWIRRDLEKNKSRPTIVAIHEPIHPPTFLDAPPLRTLLAGYPNVFAVLQGHLHVDQQYSADGKTYLVAPALGVKPNPAMKLVRVSPSALTVHTISYNVKNRRFKKQPGALTIQIPQPLRRELTRPKNSKFVQANYNSLPAKPQVQDPELQKRLNEVMRNSMMYLLRGGK